METNQDLTQKTGHGTSSLSFFSDTASTSRHLKDSDIINKIFYRFLKKEYAELEQDMISYNMNQSLIDAFFQRSGEGILDWSIGSADDVGALKFLYEHVSSRVLEEVLENSEGNYILNGFFGLAYMHETSNRWTEQKERTRVEKLKLLFQIDADKVQYYFEKYASKKYGTSALMKNYAEAFEAYQSILQLLGSPR